MAIATKAALREMVLPGLIAVLSPPIVGFLGNKTMVCGLLAGSIASGFLLAIMMANAGGAWDNAKKYAEAGMLQIFKKPGNNPRRRPEWVTIKKRTDEHSAVVTGDTVGDPFKDTSGPALNILLKLMTIIVAFFFSLDAVFFFSCPVLTLPFLL